MTKQSLEMYYDAEEVAILFNVKVHAVIYKVKHSEIFGGKWLCFDGHYYIDKNIINEITNDRLSSMDIKETALAIAHCVDATRDMLKSGRLNYFVDKWDKSYRVYKSEIESILEYETKCITADELGSYFGISANNIRKKIIYNYYNINDFVIRPYRNKIYIKREFLDHYKVLEQNTIFLERISKELKITQSNFIKVCLEYNKNILIRDFLTGKYKLKKEYIEEVKEKIYKNQTNSYSDYTQLYALLRETAMTENEMDIFAREECNINIYNDMKNLKSDKLIRRNIAYILIQKFNEYYKAKLENVNSEDSSIDAIINSEEYMSPEELGSLFDISNICIMRKIRENCCDIKDYTITKRKKIIIKRKFLYHLRQIALSSILVERAAKNIGITHNNLINKSIQLDSDSIFKDFLTSKLRIKNDFYEKIKKDLETKINEEDTNILENCYSINEFSSVLGLSINVIKKRIKSNCNSIDKFVLRSNSNKVFIKKEFLDYMNNDFYGKIKKGLKAKINKEDNKIYENCYSISELSIVLGLSINVIKQRIKSNCNNIVKFVLRSKGNGIFIKKDFVDYINDINYNSVLLLDFSKEVDIKISKLTKICLRISDNILIKDFYTNVFRIKKENIKYVRSFLTSKNLEKNEQCLSSNATYKDISEIEKNNEDYYSISQLADVLGISYGMVNNRIKSNCCNISQFVLHTNDNKILIRKDFVDYIKNLNDNSIYLKILCTEFDVKITKLKKACFQISNEILIRDFKTHEYKIKHEYMNEIRNIFQNKQLIDDDKYLSIGKASKILRTTPYIIQKLINEEPDCDYFEKYNIIYISREFINEKLKFINNSLRTDNIAKILEISRSIVLVTCREESIELIKDPLYSFKYRIEKQNIDKISQSKRVQEYKKKALYNDLSNQAKDEFDLFDKIKQNSELKVELKESNDLFSDYAYIRIGESKAREKGKFGIAKRCGNLLEFLNDTLSKNINLYSNEGINELVDKVNKSSLIKIFKGFLNYCKENTFCNFNSDYSCCEISSRQSDINPDDIYSLDKWRMYTLYLIDIDKHIINAFESQKYSCEWLLCILHLILPWRLNDIGTKIPNIELETIGIKDFKWFTDGNEFTISMGQKVFNQFDLFISGMNADKNKQELRVFYCLDFIVPIAIAYIIAEIHRRKNKNHQIFSIFMDNKYDNEVNASVRKYMSNFFNKDELKGFANREANNSLLTYTYECANTMEGMKSIAYMLEGSARSHKNDKKLLLPRATQIYLKPILHNEDAASIAYNLVRRGFFGWMPYTLLKIAYDDEEGYEDINIADMTEAIINLKDTYDLIGLEKISNCISGELYEKTQSKVLSELIRLGKAELRERIKSILTHESASKTKHGGCLKGKVCVYPRRNSCSVCEYFVKNIYFLATLNEEINRTMDIIANTHGDKQNELIKNTSVLFKLLSILGEAKLFYEEYDKNLIKAFIDLSFIKTRLKEIQDKLRYMGGTNDRRIEN